MLSISVKELHKKLVSKEDLFLIDVRTKSEHDGFNIGGLLLPLHTLLRNIARIPEDKPVVIYCEKGIRSQIAIQRLQQKSDFKNLLNLNGGMDAWINQFGHSSELQIKAVIGD